MQAELWSISGLATELEVDRKAIARKLEGLQPSETSTDKGGRITRRYRMAAVVRYLYGASSELDQRDRLASAQAEKYELENAVKRGQVASLAAIGAEVANANAAVRARLLSLPSKLGSQLTNVQDANIVSGRIKAEIFAALAELADYGSISGSDAGMARESDVSVSPASRIDGLAMGRRKPKVKQRVERRAGTVAN